MPKSAAVFAATLLLGKGGGATLDCAWLVHSSDRSIPLTWNFSVLTAATYLPLSVCRAWYFSYDNDANDELRFVVAQLPKYRRPTLLRRAEYLRQEPGQESQGRRRPKPEETWSGR